MKKSLSRVLALVLTLVLLVSAVPFAAADETETTVEINASTLTLYPLQSYTLKATVEPSGVGKSVTWSSDDKGVATVSSTGGKVTAKGCGLATITATTADGASADCTVFVQEFPVSMKDSVSVDKGDTTELTVKVDTLTEGKGFSVSYKSDDTKIATVSSKGVITGKKVGDCVVTATITPKGDYEKTHFETTTLECDVEVTDDVRIDVPDEISVAVGSSKKISADLTGGDSKYSNEEFSFEIGDDDIISEVKNSSTDTSITIKGKEPGVTTVTVSLDEAEDENDDPVYADDEVITVYVYENIDVEVILQDNVDEFDFEEDDIFEEVYIDGDEMDDPEDWTMAEILREIAGSSSSRYLTFDHSTSSSSSGELYIDSTKTNPSDDTISINSLEYVSFELGKNASEKVGYEVTTGDSDQKIAYGVITIRTAGGGDIVYTTEKGQAGAFDEADFEDFWDQVSESSSEELDYVKFTKIPAAGATYGTLYTTSSKTTKVSTSMKFELNYYSGTGTYDLDAIYYVPGANTDTVEYEFTAYGTKGNDYDGTVIIIVGGDKGDIVYKMDEKDDNVIFDEDDFIDFWEDKRDDDDEELDYVIFTDDPTSGYLYTDDDEDDEVDDEMEFYTSDTAGSKDYELDDVCYVPAKNPKSAEIEFTAYGEDGSKEKGVVYIQYGDEETESSDSITSRGVVFGKNGIDDDIIEIYEDETDGELEYVTFELPAASEGKLYYDFTKILSTDKVGTKDEFYVDPSSKQMDLAKVCFIPAAGQTGKVKIEFTAYGDEDEVEGEITLNIAAKTASAKFTDVNSKSYSWAADSVDFLYYEGVVNGTNTANTMYSPANSITRGHFMLMIYRAFLESDHATDTITSNFSDIKKGTSDYEEELYQAVGVAKKLGIAQGSGDKFNPNNKITREEAMTLVYRTLQELDMDLQYSTSKTSNSFDDSSKVSSWASDCISYLIKHGVIVGSNGNINPKSNITRAEMAVILHRVLTY